MGDRPWSLMATITIGDATKAALSIGVVPAAATTSHYPGLRETGGQEGGRACTHSGNNDHGQRPGPDRPEGQPQHQAEDAAQEVEGVGVGMGLLPIQDMMAGKIKTFITNSYNGTPLQVRGVTNPADHDRRTLGTAEAAVVEGSQDEAWRPTHRILVVTLDDDKLGQREGIISPGPSSDKGRRAPDSYQCISRSPRKTNPNRAETLQNTKAVRKESQNLSCWININSVCSVKAKVVNSQPMCLDRN